MSSGASTVEPNMATTCCTPMASVCGAGSRSSAAITAPWPSLVLWRSRHWGKYEPDMEIPFVVDLF